MQYLSIPGGILANKGLGSLDKFIIAYLLYLQKYDKVFFGAFSTLADLLGADEKFLGVRFKKLIDFGVIGKNEEGYYLLLSSGQLEAFKVSAEGRQAVATAIASTARALSANLEQGV